MLKTKGKKTTAISMKEKHGFGRELKKNRLLFLMILPAIIFVLIFNYAPMAGVVVAFKNFNYGQGIMDSPWVGLDNFRFLIQGGVLWRITRNTILYNLAFIVVDTVSQIAVAIMISEVASKWFRKVGQSLMFLPYFVSFVLVQSISYGIFNYEYGLLNNILQKLGMDPVNVYATTAAWPFILIFFHVWKGIGYGVVVYLATITGINSEYYEAARVDGATKWQQIRLITLPLLKPTVIILTMFSVGRIMRGQFELFYQLTGTNGMLYEVTDIIDTYVFRSITQTFDPGRSTAAGLYQSIFGLVLILIVNKLVKKVEPDYALF